MIHAENIVKSFGKVEVLKGLSLDVKKGELVAIMGASGAGKSTLLQILGTLLSPDSGSLSIDGMAVERLKGNDAADFRCRRIGFVFQAHHLLAEFTALENVMLPAMIAGKKEAQSREKALSMLTLVGLGERVSHKPSELSGGEQQRVAIARALVNDPAILLADEPTGNLDSITKGEIHSLFLSLRESLGQTIVIVTHEEPLAGLCDRTLRMKDGVFVG